MGLSRLSLKINFPVGGEMDKVSGGQDSSGVRHPGSGGGSQVVVS